MPPATTSIADVGYHEAIRLMAHGGLSIVQLWRPRAFDRYRAAVANGVPNQAWMEQFVRDIRETLGDEHDYYAEFIAPGNGSYPASALETETGPVAVIRFIVDGGPEAGGRSRTIIIRPKADQVLQPVMRMRFFP